MVRLRVEVGTAKGLLDALASFISIFTGDERL